MIIDTLFDDIFNHTRNFERIHNSFLPDAVNNETETGHEIQIAVPGIKQEEISVELDAAKNEVIIELDTDSTFVSKFKRVYRIPQSIDLDSVQVNVELGVITITMERKAEAARKKLL